MKRVIFPLVCVLAAGMATGCLTTDEYELQPGTSSGTTQDDILDDEQPDVVTEGTYTFSSDDTEAVADNISHSIFDRWITLTWSDSGVEVEGDERGIVTVSGTLVTVRNSGYKNDNDDLDKIVYELKGSCSNGSFTIYGTRKQCLYLNGVSLTNPSGAAINNQCKKRTFVRVAGSNTLADGSSAAYATTGEEDMKAVLFSEGQLVFSGDGSLTVTANNKQGKAGITSDEGDLRFQCRARHPRQGIRRNRQRRPEHFGFGQHEKRRDFRFAGPDQGRRDHGECLRQRSLRQ